MIRRQSVTKCLAALTLALSLAPTTAGADPLPAPWQSADIGAVGLAGDISYLNGRLQLLINAAGSDIWGTADSFHFVYREMHDGLIRAATPSLENTHPFAKAGIMIRRSLDPGSPFVILDMKPDGGIEFMMRAQPNGETVFIAGGIPATAPLALELVRLNGVITARLCVASGPGIDCQTLATAPFDAGAALVGPAVTSHDTSVLNHSVFPGGLPNVTTTPRPWFNFDVGDVGIAGSAFFENGTFTVQGAGADIWGTRDAFQFVRVPQTGDGEVVARVTSQQAANTFAKAGVLMRDSGWFTVVLDIRPNGVIEFMARSTSDGQMQFVAGSAASLPVWLKLERNGNQFTGSMSNDGQSWQVVGLTTVPMFTSYDGGIAVTAHDTSALNTATFDHVRGASVGQWLDEDIGDTGIAGQVPVFSGAPNFDSNLGRREIQAGGADIWGTADAFHYLYKALFDDGEASVVITRLDNTSPFAKAGLMIRGSLDPSAAHVIVDIRPDGNIEFMTRSSTGAETTFLTTAPPMTFPMQLRIKRSGSAITAFTAPGDSTTTWTEVGTVSTPLPSDALIGFAVTSHQRGVLTTGAFAALFP